MKLWSSSSRGYPERIGNGLINRRLVKWVRLPHPLFIYNMGAWQNHIILVQTVLVMEELGST